MISGTLKKRTCAMLLLVAFVLVTFLSATLILSSANHEHDHLGPGGTCVVCAQLHAAKRLFNCLSAVIIASAAAHGACLSLEAILRALEKQSKGHTLVSLKIRLNN